MKVLEIRQATKLYKNGRGIRNISLDIRQGDVFGLFGPNGAGKTTLLKVVTGLCTADRGSVTIFGRSLSDEFEQAMEHVGCVIETADAYEYMSGYQNLKISSRYYQGITDRHIEETLKKVSLERFAHDKVEGYSLGMKMRLALAAALISNPELVILDEPTNGLDIEGMMDVRNILLDLARNNGVTFLISSHQIDGMQTICNRVGILANGELIKQVSTEDISAGQESLKKWYTETVQTWKEAVAHASSVCRYNQ